MKWTYQRDGGENYPVKFGDVWTVGNSAVLICGDIEQGHGDMLPDYLVWGPVSLLYCDPPWGAALARGFRTKSGVDGDSGKIVDFDIFLRRFALIAKLYYEVPTLVEMGLSWEDDMDAAFIHADAQVVSKRWRTTYYGSRPSSLHLYQWAGAPLLSDVPNFEGMDDGKTPALAVSSLCREGSMVVDLFTGRGLTAKEALGIGRGFGGLELSPYRASAALTTMAGITGATPKKIDEVT
tara:strand:- start:1739 stop:2449 length:711 start_codon:yes stop_codon:yes gene_type:complete